jgi:hypothetical protein
MKVLSEKQYRKWAIDILKGFVFTSLVDSSIVDSIDVWRCKNPDTSTYAFDIMITRYGISIMGDISNITFRVGASYGMKFLAGKDVEYYIHSKLDTAFYEKNDFDEQSFMNGVAHRIGDALWDELDGDAPAWFNTRECTSKKLKSWLDKKPSKIENLSLDYQEEFQMAGHVTEIREAEDYLVGSSLFNDPNSWPSYKMTSSSMLYELYLINEAARRIIAQDPIRYHVEPEHL